MVKTLWPNDLSVFYPYPASIPFWQVLGAIVLLGAVTIAVILTAKKFPYLAFGWLWFAGTLIPVIGIVQVGRQAMADRYTYVPLIGLFVVVVWGVPELLRKFLPARPINKESFLASAAALIFLSLLIVTSIQVGYWRDSISLHLHALKVTSSTANNDVIYNNLGCAYDRTGDFSRAIEQLDKAIEINPRYGDAYNNRGIVYSKIGKYRQAIMDYDRAIAIDSGSARNFGNRGFAYNALGNYKEAIKDYGRVIEIEPETTKAYIGRGIACISSGNRAQAIEDFQKAIEIDPKYADAYFNLASAYLEAGNLEQAISIFGKAIELIPHYVPAIVNRGRAYLAFGDYAKAKEDFNRAIELHPDDWRAYDNRAIANDKLGDKGKALDDMRKAKRLREHEAKGAK